MKRKLFVAIIFLMLLAVTSFPSFAAGNPQLQVNGDIVPAPGLSLENSISMIPVDVYARLAGADTDSSADAVTITENGTTMQMTLGSQEAILGDKSVSLPAEPVNKDGSILIPLRAVSSAFGFEVGWDAEKRLVTLTRSETRDGLSVSDLLAKSTEASLVYNTYSMEGLVNIGLDLTTDGKADRQAPRSMTTKLTGQIQNKPLQVYMNQIITMPGAGGTNQETTVEVFMTQEKMYIKAPGQGWMASPMPFSPEFWQQQQDIQSDPLKAAALLKEMGILLNFGNDTVVDGTGYYVVNATMDMDKFKQGYEKILQQAVQSLPQGAPANPAEMQAVMQKLLENAQFDYSYSVLINKETLISDIIKFDGRMIITLDNPQAGASGEPGQMKMDMRFKGDMSISGLGGAFIAPDVSSATELTVPQ
ncbi:copper amine oxidase N-terminal domain-containing protein [Pelotomaculum propionicicum]|uniref:Copper amine oxidase-like N-terminal domain-containing protein n=1 Tax=Pelotomaculum propionicicum TaxID=258475 RepID=A0A4Y7RSK7_9FIRM|nr:copper amine oxidase N-terminal domain-containing protein [Pelotomaculum propionicicum]NLI13058.1 copper amine oxidase N-terminal domain-containing protein [Peptococcaceae bacterium]TEB11841.1 hypothetical protein Pmgp_01419 [Pelotomaculum propionicicum]